MDYKYYVYVKPGHIEYFDIYSKALECAEIYYTVVMECQS